MISLKKNTLEILARDYLPQATYHQDDEDDFGWLNLAIGPAYAVNDICPINTGFTPDLETQKINVSTSFQCNQLSDRYIRSYTDILVNALTDHGIEHSQFKEYKSDLFWNNLEPSPEFDIELNLPMKTEDDIALLLKGYAVFYRVTSELLALRRERTER